MTPTDVIAIYGAVLSTIVLIVQGATFLRGRDHLVVALSTGIPIGMMERFGTLVQATITSQGDRPVGVSGLQLKLTGGKYVPFMEHLPLQGSVTLPRVMRRGEWSTYWLARGPLEESLRESGLRIQKVVAIMSDGRRIERGVDRSFRQLGSHRIGGAS